MTLQKNKIIFGFNRTSVLHSGIKKCNGNLEGKKKKWKSNKKKKTKTTTLPPEKVKS